MLLTALLLSTLAAASADSSAVATPPRAACSVLTLEDVRQIVAAPVDVFPAGSFAPKESNGTTTSNCTYVTSAKSSRGARVTLMWAASAKLSETNAYYVKRNKELPKVVGDMLVLASVTDGSSAGMQYDRAASEKLLAAVLRALPH